MSEPALGRAAATISALTAAARVSGFVRVLVVTAVLGTTYLGNVYQAANGVPNVVFELFAAGALHAVLVPALVGAFDRGGRVGVERLAGGVLGAVLAGLAVVTLIGIVAAPLIMRLLTAGVDDPTVRDAQIDLGTVLLIVFLPQVVLYGIGMVATGALHATNRFAAPAAAPLANNVVVIAAYAAFWWLRRDAGPWPADGLSPIEVAVLGGGTTLGVVALTAVPWLALARSGVRLRPSWRPRDPEVRRLGRHGGWAAGQVAAMQGLTVLILVLANAVAGGVVAFQFGTTFFLLPIALVALPITTAVYPTLSRAGGDGSRAALARATVATCALLVPAVAALSALAWPLVRVTAFGQAADAGLGALAAAVAWSAPGVLGYGLVLLFTRALYARGDARTPAIVLAGVLAVVAVAMVVLAPADVEGRMAVLAGLQSAGYLVAAAVLAWHLVRVTAGGVGSGVVALARLAGAGVVAAAAMGAVVAATQPTGRWSSLLVLVLGGLAGAAVYAGVLQVTGPGLRTLMRLDSPARPLPDPSEASRG